MQTDVTSQRHQVIVLARLARPAEIGRAGAQKAVIDAIALEVHQFAARRTRPNFEAMKGLHVEFAQSRHFARVAPDSHFHTVHGRRAQRLDDGAVSQHIGRHVDLLGSFMQQGHVDPLEVLAGAVMDLRRRAGGQGD